MNATAKARLFAAALASLVIAGPASAANIIPPTPSSGATIFLNQSGQDDLLPDGQDYLRVDIADGKNGEINFYVAPLQPLFDLVNQFELKNAGIQAFAFNLGNSGASIENIVPANTSWSVGGESVFNDFGEFDVVLRGGVRKSLLSFSIVGIEGDTVNDYLTMLSQGQASQGNWLFGAELGADHVPEELAHLNPGSFAGGTVVPLPAAALLMLSALGLLSFLRRSSSAARA